MKFQETWPFPVFFLSFSELIDTIKFFPCHFKEQNFFLNKKASKSFQAKIQTLQEVNDITVYV